MEPAVVIVAKWMPAEEVNSWCAGGFLSPSVVFLCYADVLARILGLSGSIGELASFVG